MTNTRHPDRAMTPPELARLWAVDPDKIRRWIDAGELEAVDLSASQGQRPRWHILPAAAEAFLARRANRRPAKSTRRRRAAAPAKTYF